MRSAAIVVALVACVHAGLWAIGRQEVSAPEIAGPLASVSYAPFAHSDRPDAGTLARAEQIRSDLTIIAPLARSVRTYSATGGVELVPEIAADLGLRVTVGAWIDKDLDRNAREIRAAIELAYQHHNINSIVVGNETVFRKDQTPDELIKLIQQVKRTSPVPVTTGEIWHVWIDHPELVSAVDYIAAHILPYWEGFSENQAVDQALLIYEKLRRAYPGKRIVIAEFGWPSAGYNLKDARPGRLIQAQVLRDFVKRADALGIEYNIVEAIDQPWKIFEGGVGPYWGMLDASRNFKFGWSGPISDNDHWKIAGLAVLLGLLLAVPILAMHGATLGQILLLAAASHLVGAWFANVIGFWHVHYFTTGTAFALGTGVALLIPLVIIALARIDEIGAIAFGTKPRRMIAAPLTSHNAHAPKVSIHVPAYREPPEMLKQTLDAVARLDYPNFECVVVVNNTPDPAMWRPVEQHCLALGPRFKFVNVDNMAGYKAGALRHAMTHTAADTEIIGVIDADYAVQSNWLSDLVPVFADPAVGLIQAPQDHRDGTRSLMHHAMNGEYAGFFDIGMVQRNELNAIIVHGTMCLVRRAALEAVGNWSSDTICEDTDLGLCLLEQGWQTLYTNKRYGYGLLPDSFDAYKKQRHRWAYGGLQIMKKHWRRFLPGATGLTRDQKRVFALGWLNWLGAESLGVAVAMLNIIWVPVVAFLDISVPDKILTIPIIASFAVSVLHFASLYRLRVSISATHMLGAVFAAMSLQWTVARAIGNGLVKDHLPFTRTAKGGVTLRLGDFHAFWEALLAGLLLLGAAVLIATNVKEVVEIKVFAAVLIVQSIPFLAAVGLAVLERTRLNDFAYWSALETRFAELLPRRRVIAKIWATTKQHRLRRQG